MAATKATVPAHVVEAAETVRATSEALARHADEVEAVMGPLVDACAVLQAWRPGDDWEAKLSDVGVADSWEALDGTADRIGSAVDLYR